MRRLTSVFFVIILLVIISATAILADTGCFLEPESEEYCTQINIDEAEFECSLYDTCNLDTAFLESKRCTLFEECEEILCQSSCEYEIAGLCSSGAVPDGEEDLWCQSEGCCQYWPDASEPGCQIEENKWACHITASNAGADQLNWDQSISQTNCEEVCLADNYPYTAQLLTNDLKFYTQETIPSSSSQTPQNTNEATTTESKETTESNSGTTSGEEIIDKLIKLLAPIFLLFVAILISIFFYEHRHTIIKDYHQIKSKVTKTKVNKKSNNSFSEEPENLKELPSNQSTDFGVSLTNSHSHHKHNHKKQHAQLELAESFAQFTPTPVPNTSGMQKLQRMVNQYTRKSSRKKRSKDNLATKLSDPSQK